MNCSFMVNIKKAKRGVTSQKVVGKLSCKVFSVLIKYIQPIILMRFSSVYSDIHWLTTVHTETQPQRKSNTKKVHSSL